MLFCAAPLPRTFFLDISLSLHLCLSQCLPALLAHEEEEAWAVCLYCLQGAMSAASEARDKLVLRGEKLKVRGGRWRRKKSIQLGWVEWARPGDVSLLGHMSPVCLFRSSS